MNCVDSATGLLPSVVSVVSVEFAGGSSVVWIGDLRSHPNRRPALIDDAGIERASLSVDAIALESFGILRGRPGMCLPSRWRAAAQADFSTGGGSSSPEALIPKNAATAETPPSTIAISKPSPPEERLDLSNGARFEIGEFRRIGDLVVGGQRWQVRRRGGHSERSEMMFAGRYGVKTHRTPDGFAKIAEIEHNVVICRGGL